jgi:drug/metabolite transporter (DMT)-like permease
MSFKNWLQFILLGAVWGSSFLWIKIGVQEISPVLLVAMRLGFGFIGLAVTAIFVRPAMPGSWKPILALILFGFTNNAIPYVLISWGEQSIDSAAAAILNSTTPLFTMILAPMFIREEKLTIWRIAGLLTGFAGVLILLTGEIKADAVTFWGSAAVLFASFCYAGSSIFARQTTSGLHPLTQAIIPLIGADTALWILAINLEKPFTLPSLPMTWIAAAWLGLLGTCLAFLLFFSLLNQVGPTRTTLVTYLFPLVGVLLGVLLLKESLTWRLVLGGMLIISGVIVVNRTQKKEVNSGGTT